MFYNYIFTSQPDYHLIKHEGGPFPTGTSAEDWTFFDKVPVADRTTVAMIGEHGYYLFRRTKNVDFHMLAIEPDPIVKAQPGF